MIANRQQDQSALIATLQMHDRAQQHNAGPLSETGKDTILLEFAFGVRIKGSKNIYDFMIKLEFHIVSQKFPGIFGQDGKLIDWLVGVRMLGGIFNTRMSQEENRIHF